MTRKRTRIVPSKDSMIRPFVRYPKPKNGSIGKAFNRKIVRGRKKR